MIGKSKNTKQYRAVAAGISFPRRRRDDLVPVSIAAREARLFIPSDEARSYYNRFCEALFGIRNAFPVHFVIFGSRHFFPGDLDVVGQVEHVAPGGLAWQNSYFKFSRRFLVIGRLTNRHSDLSVADFYAGDCGSGDSGNRAVLRRADNPFRHIFDHDCGCFAGHDRCL